MTEFPLSLALYNFLPVGLTGVALWFLFRLVRDQDPGNGAVGAARGRAGPAWGLSKASWKLLASLTGVDIAWLGAALFPLMAPGFALLAAAIWGATRRLRGLSSPVWLRGAALAAVAIAFGFAAVRLWVLEIPRGWFLPLLALASLGNLLLSILLIAAALRLRRWGIALLFGVNLGMVFALQPIAMANPKTLPMHWLEQSMTAVGTACFALGAYLLWQVGSGADRLRAPDKLGGGLGSSTGAGLRIVSTQPGCYSSSQSTVSPTSSESPPMTAVAPSRQPVVEPPVPPQGRRLSPHDRGRYLRRRRPAIRP